MSASREKKRRQELSASGSMNPKSAREAEQQAADKKANMLYAAAAVAFVVLAVFLVVYNSGIIDRNKTAVTVDGQKFTVAEAAYYYQQAYQNYLNTSNGYYAVALGMLDTSTPLKSQSFDDTQTWDDFFQGQAVSDMQFVHAAKKAAQAENMKLEQEDLDSYNENLKAFKNAAASAGFTYKSYLTAIYGAVMTPSVYESCEKDRRLASKYASAQHDALSFDESEVTAYYNENKNDFDLVDGAYVSVSGRPETKTDADGNAIEATDEEKAAALDAAKATAEEILAAYQEGGNLETLADEHDAGYFADEKISYNSTVYSEWLFDSSRRAGDIEVVENEGDSQYYVILFNGRERRDTLNYNVRHILVTEDNLELEEGAEAEEGQVQAKAEEIFASWDGSEDGFAALANEFSQDGGSNTNGGLYENVADGDMVPAFNDWCYAAGRKAGDSGIVASDYGQHIMYFVGYTDKEYWYQACENALIEDAFSNWYSEMTDSVAAEVNENAMNAVGK